METIGEIAGRVVAMAVRASTTPKVRPNTEAWAKWAGFEINGTESERLQLKQMIDETAHFCREVKNGDEPRWLSFLGSPGVGKTFLAKRIWRWFRESPMFQTSMVNGRDGRPEVVYAGQWCYWPNLSRELAGNHGYDLLDELSREKFVCLDEIGSDRDASGHIKDCLAKMLCARVGKWTIITSNRTLEEIATGIDQRIASRMIRDGSKVVEIDAKDYALR